MTLSLCYPYPSKCGGAATSMCDTALAQAYNILIEDLNMLQKERRPA
ncbi:MAG: hypothetical protein ACOYMH_14560 [Zwartia sp.]|jgi:hypothetical protein